MQQLVHVLLAGALPAEQWREYKLLIEQQSTVLGIENISVHFEEELSADVSGELRRLIGIVVVANPRPGLVASLPRLKLIQSLWAGVDKLLLDSTLPTKVPVARLVDPAMTETMTQTALGHVMWLHRKMHQYYAQQKKQQWQQLEHQSTAQTTVGVIGYGELGKATGQLLRMLGFTVLGYRRTEPEPSVYVGESGLTHVLQSSDIVINLLPLVADTKGFFNSQRFLQFKQGACFVNLARGAHVIEPDLQEALSSRLAFAILDVFNTEPLEPNHWFWNHPKVVVTPHVAADTRLQTAVPVVVENLRRVALGLEPLYLVDRKSGY